MLLAIVGYMGILWKSRAMCWGTGWLSRLVGHFVEEWSDVLGNWVAQSVRWAFCGRVERCVGELGGSVG